MKKKRGDKKFRIFNVQVHLTNRWLYTFIALGILAIIGVGVYALTPGVKPNPGHLASEMAPPNPCASGQFLKFDGTNWVCATPTGGISGSGTANYLPKWTGASSLGNSIIFDNGNVGIGTTNPTEKLDVEGYMRLRVQTAPSYSKVVSGGVNRFSHSSCTVNERGKIAFFALPSGDALCYCGLYHPTSTTYEWNCFS